jgi:hypothetical protein
VGENELVELLTFSDEVGETAIEQDAVKNTLFL